MSIKLTNAALDIHQRGNTDTLVIRGVIDPMSLKDIKIDSYQRENVSKGKILALANAIEKSSVPDIELGMRGEKHQERDNGKTFILQDDIYVIDGLQRITAALEVIRRPQASMPRIGALVHLNTTFDWERERFRILNQERTKISPNVLLRNRRQDNPSIDMIAHLTEDKAFALCNRISWAQNMCRGQILPALTLCKTIGRLHARFGPGRGSDLIELSNGLDKIMEKIGRNTLRENAKEFFDLLDHCFGVRRLVYVHSAVQTKSTFLQTMADVLTRHEDFWTDHKLTVSTDLTRKIALFPIDDPEVARLGGSAGKAKDLLYHLLVDHINSGKRTRRLRLSPGYEEVVTEREDETAVAS